MKCFLTNSWDPKSEDLLITNEGVQTFSSTYLSIAENLTDI